MKQLRFVKNSRLIHLFQIGLPIICQEVRIKGVFKLCPTPEEERSLDQNEL